MIRRVRPVWPCPRNVRAFTTTRAGGVSEGCWHSFNLGLRCGDDEEIVRENRARLGMALPGPPGWLRQVHGNRVVMRESFATEVPEADAVVSSTPGLPCTILTADCLPILLCSDDGSQVAAAHAGWRGLVAGVVEATVQAMHSEAASLIAWLGPGISQAAYEVGQSMRETVLEAYPDAREMFLPDGDRWRADLFGIARLAIRSAGVKRIYGGAHCTFTDSERFYSYRRDGETGRMATVIWFQDLPIETEPAE